MYRLRSDVASQIHRPLLLVPTAPLDLSGVGAEQARSLLHGALASAGRALVEAWVAEVTKPWDEAGRPLRVVGPLDLVAKAAAPVTGRVFDPSVAPVALLDVRPLADADRAYSGQSEIASHYTGFHWLRDHLKFVVEPYGAELQQAGYTGGLRAVGIESVTDTAAVVKACRNPRVAFVLIGADLSRGGVLPEGAKVKDMLNALLTRGTSRPPSGSRGAGTARHRGTRGTELTVTGTGPRDT